MAPPNKKRKLKESKTAEVVFDPSARFDYLTGFHKRKLERAKKAQEAAKLKARQEKIEDRKKLRDERKAELEAHVKAVNATMLPVLRPVTDSEDESADEDNDDGWNGIPDAVLETVDHEEEYVDEDKYTTVTVEEVDISRDGMRKLQGTEEDEKEPPKVAQEPTPTAKPKKDPSKGTRDKDKKVKKKRKSFRYESPAERKVNRLKVRAKNSKAAKARRGE